MNTPVSRADRSSPRTLAAWALVGYAGLHLVFAFFDWVLPGGGPFGLRSQLAGFDNIFVMALPAIAVLLAARVQPALPAARQITSLALIEYAVSLGFGVITLLIGLGPAFDRADSANAVFDSLGYLVLGLARLGLIAVAALFTSATHTGLGGRLPAVTVSMRPPTGSPGAPGGSEPPTRPWTPTPPPGPTS